MTAITNGAIVFDPDELTWWVENYGDTEWIAYFAGMDEITTHDQQYPGNGDDDNPAGNPFTEETIRAYAHPGDCACGSPYSDVEEAQQREIAAIEWAVHIAGVGVLARQDNNPAHPLFTEETARQYASWANAEMTWLGEANSATVLHYGVPVETAGAR